MAVNVLIYINTMTPLTDLSLYYDRRQLHHAKISYDLRDKVL